MVLQASKTSTVLIVGPKRTRSQGCPQIHSVCASTPGTSPPINISERNNQDRFIVPHSPACGWGPWALEVG